MLVQIADGLFLAGSNLNYGMVITWGDESKSESMLSIPIKVSSNIWVFDAAIPPPFLFF